MATTDLASQRDLALLRRYHLRGDQQARTQMVERGLPLVRSLVRRYRGKGEPVDDLVQVGSVGLVKAVDRFDVAAGYPFTAFAVPNITGEIKRHFRDFGWVAHVPRPVQELDARVRGAQYELAARPGARTDAASLATELDEPIDDVREALRARGSQRPASLHGAGDGDESPAVVVGGEDAALLGVEARALVRECSSVLSERERAIVWMRFFADMLQREIALEVGVSQMQVSRLLRGALKRMRAAVDEEPRDPGADRSRGPLPPPDRRASGVAGGGSPAGDGARS